MSAQQEFSRASQVHEDIKRIISVELNKKKSDEYCKTLFSSLTDQYKFRNNKYTYCGSYDLSQWLVLCFASLVRENEKLYTELVLPLVAYISIVDDACDERISDSSIEEMEQHCNIFKGSVVNKSSPSLDMGKELFAKLNGQQEYDGIKAKILEFLVTGSHLIERAKNGCEMEEKVSQSKLDSFLEERRIDSMASLFFSINNTLNRKLPNVEGNSIVHEYSIAAADVISLINDVASLAKDSKKVVNNYIILHHGQKNNMSIKELITQPIDSFQDSLLATLKLVQNKLTTMATIKSDNQNLTAAFESIDEVMKGYCTWCMISKRFQRADHIIPDYLPSQQSPIMKTLKGVAVLIPFLKPWRDDDMETYLDDIEKLSTMNNTNNMKDQSMQFVVDCLNEVWKNLLDFSINM